MDVQQFERLLMRYERLAGRSAALTELQRRYTATLGALTTAQNGNSQRDRDMEAAQAKIEEWRVFAGMLLHLIGPKRFKEVPSPPKPLEFEMPF